MTVQTYEQVADLIRGIRSSKNIIKNNNKRIDEDLKALNKLLKKNGQPEMRLEDIKPYPERSRYGCRLEDEDEEE